MSANVSNRVVLTNSEIVKLTPKELFFKYLSYLPYFLLSLILCICVGILYTRYVTPTYKASAKIFVKNDKDNTSNRSGNTDLIDNAMFGGKQVNIDNEIVLISSKKLLQRVVSRHNYNISYFQEGNIRSSEMYNQMPFLFEALSIPDSNATYRFQLKDITSRGASLVIPDSPDIPAQHFQWQQAVTANGCSVRFSAGSHIALASKATYTIQWEPTMKVATSLQQHLSASAYNARTTIIKLDLTGTHPQKAADILNDIVEEYAQVNIEDKNKISENTIRFITKRLDIVTSELTGVEDTLQDFRDKFMLIDASQQAQQALEKTGELDKDITTIQVQQQVIDMLKDYISSPVNENALVPSNMGIEDPALAELVSKYNEMVLLRNKELPSLTSGGLVLQDLNGQMSEVKKSLLAGLDNIHRNLSNQYQTLQLKNKQQMTLLGKVPGKERALQEIRRQQNVKEGLYLYLLQKREETAIAASSTISNYNLIEPPTAYLQPVEPDKGKIRLFSIVIGLLLPIAVIYGIDLFKDKIHSREDISKKTQTPILGEIGHIEGEEALVVVDKTRSIVAEQFRIMRANLQFLNPSNKTMLVTSSISGEGKSFISLNLAAVLALSGKKVALLEFDLRKPKLLTSLGIKPKNVGISNFLIGQPVQPEEMYTSLEDYKSLHLFGSGPIPPNPAELMLNDQLKLFFDLLNREYDYVIIDSAPVGLVGDSFTLAPYCDTVLYIIRQRYTLKKQIDFVDDIYTAKRFRNMGLVVNDVKLGGRYGYYGYGQSYGSSHYGYGKAYGYPDEEKKWWKKWFS